MQSIVSGSSTERVVRSVIIMLVVCGFCMAFFWDGYIGYPRENAKGLLKSLGMKTDRPIAINEELTESLGREVVGTVSKGDRYAVVAQKLGEPTFERGDDAYFVGPSGYLAVRRQGASSVSSARIDDIVWVDGTHSHVDLMVQLWLGYALGVFGLFTIFQLIRTTTNRVTLCDTGLTIRSRPAIAFESMREFKGTRGNVAVLLYSVGGQDRTVRLDPYDIKEAKAIVEAISAKLGCPNPLSVTPEKPS